MSENKDQKTKRKPTGGSPKGSPNSKKPFNFYWIYAIIGVLLIGFNLLNFNSSLKKTDWNKFEQNMLKQGDVSRLVVVNNEQRVEIHIKSDRLSQDKYKDVRTKTLGKIDNNGPHYYFPIGSIEQFNIDLNEAQKISPKLIA